MITKNIGVTYEAGEFKPELNEMGEIPVIIGQTNNDSSESHQTDGKNILKYESYEKAAKPVSEGGIATYEIPKSHVKIVVKDEDESIYEKANIILKNRDTSEETTLIFKNDSYQGEVIIGQYQITVDGENINSKIENIDISKLQIDAEYTITRNSDVTFEIKAKQITKELKIRVHNEEGSVIENASVTVDKQTKNTNNEGIAVFNVIRGEHDLGVIADNKKIHYQKITVMDNIEQSVTLENSLTYDAEITVKDKNTQKVIKDAKIQMKYDNITIVNGVTDNAGKCEIDFLNVNVDNYSVICSADGYEESSSSVSIQARTNIIEIELSPLTKAQLKKLKSESNDDEELKPVIGANVKLGGTLLTETETGIYSVAKYPHNKVDITIETEDYSDVEKELNILGGSYTQTIIIKENPEDPADFNDPIIGEDTKENSKIDRTSYHAEGEGKPVLRENPVLNCLKTLFEMNDLVTSEDRAFPYLYVIDLGKANNETHWENAFDKSKALIEVYWEIYVGSEALGIDKIEGLMNKASQNIVNYEENLILREGICILHENLTDEKHISYCENNIMHITFVEPGKLGATAAGRIILTPFWIEPGYLKIKNLNNDEVKLRSLSEIKKLYFSGATFIRLEKENNQTYPRINLAITSEWNNKNYPARSELKNVRIANALLREIFDAVHQYIKRNETEMYIAMIQAIVNAKINKFVQNNYVQSYDPVTRPNGTNLPVGIDDNEEGGILIRGNILPVGTIKTIKIYSTITK